MVGFAAVVVARGTDGDGPSQEFALDAAAGIDMRLDPVWSDWRSAAGPLGNECVQDDAADLARRDSANRSSAGPPWRRTRCSAGRWR